MRLATLQACGLCLSVLAIHLPAAEPTPKTIKPVAVFSGANSRIEQPSLEVVTSADGWDRLWAKHLGTTTDDAYRPLAEVDFDCCMVVAILPGNQVNVRGVKIESIIDEKDALRIRFDNVGYQTAGESNRKPPDKPYAFVILPKSDKTIVTEENAQIYNGQPPQWKEWRRAKRP
jgi:hypothetical protein